MNYAKRMFGRMNLQEVSCFFMHGTEDCIEEKQPYKEKLKRESSPIYSRLESLCPNEEDLDTAVDDLSRALIAYEEVYMEIGMKAGARLLFQLLHEDDCMQSENVEKK